jgi:iron complex transport system substrate-binding protein
VGRENVAMLDTDAAVVIGEPADPLHAELANVREGRAVVLDEHDGAWAAALAHLSPLTLPYVLDAVVPALAAAADGDPATAVPAEPPLTAVDTAVDTA